ncbi:hypothetical protein GDO86_004779 [Hymenochirus boettgeri]|uniref:WD repeat-containing protein 73 n=1 Tax=Hymenochirus boettgeri TaxID=247094 RepID=A0A8T2KEN6_9PIPI|nr:hypothetical protein GDO86_004779 [Hymenochirus boettgeri]
MEDEQYEEWMLQSIGLYKDLHDFELQDPTRVIEWIGDNSICVAGYEGNKRNEILQLLVPQKLQTTENPGLCPERDLKVEHGGFVDEPVYSLKHIPQSSFLVTSGPATCPLRVWKIGPEDRDVIYPVGTIPSENGEDSWSKIATTSLAPPCVLHGSQANKIHLTEIESSKRVCTLGLYVRDPVSVLSFLDSRTVFLCCKNGRQYIVDVRQPRSAAEGIVGGEALSDATWCAAVQPWKEEACSMVACVSSNGHMILTDTRDFTAPLKRGMWHIPGPSLSDQFLNVCWAPSLVDCISISGYGGSVDIFDTKCWDLSMQSREPLFTHRGHSVMGACGNRREPVVTAHTWHPWKERTVLSAASDGSLHVWNWSDSQACKKTQL